jgi:hypothetical protein
MRSATPHVTASTALRLYVVHDASPPLPYDYSNIVSPYRCNVSRQVPPLQATVEGGNQGSAISGDTAGNPLPSFCVHICVCWLVKN